MELHRSGALLEARGAYEALLAETPTRADAVGLLGVVESQLGHHERAVRLLRDAERLAPKSASILTNLGEALSAAGRPADAEEVLRRSIALDPRVPETHANLANVLEQLDRPEEAARQWERVLGLRDGAEARYRLGTLWLGLGRSDEARAALERAVTLDPDMIGAWQNLAVLAYRRGDMSGSERCYSRMLELEPGSAIALRGLGQILRDRGDATGSVALLWEAVRRDVDDGPAWSGFAETFGQVILTDEGELETAERILEACLQHPAVNPQDVAGQAVRVLSGGGALGPLLAATGDSTSLDALLDRPETWSALSRPVLLHALCAVVLPDLGMERLLRAVRRRLLAAVAAGRMDDPALAEPALLEAIARQAFLNGYVWTHEADEVAAVEQLVARMAGRALGSDPADVPSILALAAYVPLLEWERAEEVYALAQEGAHAGVIGVVVQQILEPLQEEELRDTLPVFAAPEDAVSQQVRAMYEESPYPRWTRYGHRRARPLHAVLTELFPGREFASAAALQRPRVLVAGCGTGLHLIEVAQRYADAHVTGIDLSLSSLAFAARKLRESGLERVDLMQADILALHRWEETFDLIESVGVLHHMADPIAGWRALTGRLRPGGFMRIGLYSELARASVVAARELIAREGFPDDADGIRAARHALMRTLGDEHAQLFRWRDFYSLQEVRDLVFHVQEHRFTIPQIQDALRTLGLEFVGFDLRGPALLNGFRERFPEPGSESDLAAWAVYEAENPGAFAAMYQFWVRKA
ncbi:MAG: tetratricopeptide repeat protein [Gemmatimonadota bacterium]